MKKQEGLQSIWGWLLSSPGLIRTIWANILILWTTSLQWWVRHNFFENTCTTSYTKATQIMSHLQAHLFRVFVIDIHIHSHGQSVQVPCRCWICLGKYVQCEEQHWLCLVWLSWNWANVHDDIFKTKVKLQTNTTGILRYYKTISTQLLMPKNKVMRI